MNHEEIQGYTIFRTVWEALQSFEDPLLRLEIREALDNYAFTGMWNLEDMSPMGKMFFTLQKPVIDSNLTRITQGRKGGKAPRKAGLEKSTEEASSKNLSQLPRDKDKDEVQVQIKNQIQEQTEDQDAPLPLTGKSPSSSSSSSSVIEISSLDFYLEQGRWLSDSEKIELVTFEKKLGRDVVMRAIDITLSKKKTFAYLLGILTNKEEEGVTSLALWDKVQEKKYGIYTPKTHGTKSETNYYDGMTEEEEAFWREKNNDYSSTGSS